MQKFPRDLSARIAQLYEQNSALRSELQNITLHGLNGVGKSQIKKDLEEQLPRIEVTEAFRSPNNSRRIYADWNVYPISMSEIARMYPSTNLIDTLPERIILGSLPEVIAAVTTPEKRKIVNKRYKKLIKDIMTNQNFEHPQKFLETVYLLAKGIGDPQSFSKIAEILQINPRTAKRYVDLLIDYNVIVEIKGLKQKLSTEVNKFSKYYFTDLGIRNAAIDNLRPLKERKDTEEIWENFLIIERIKALQITDTNTKMFYWKTYEKEELHCVEVTELENSTHYKAYKFSFVPKPSFRKAPKCFERAYKMTDYKQVTPTNFTEFMK